MSKWISKKDKSGKVKHIPIKDEHDNVHAQKGQFEIKQKINALRMKAMDEGEAFVATLSGKQLRNAGFGELWAPADEFWAGVQYVDIYLLYDNGKYKLKYVFNGDPGDAYYESEKEIGSETLWEAVADYLSEAKKE